MSGEGGDTPDRATPVFCAPVWNLVEPPPPGSLGRAALALAAVAILALVGLVAV